MNKKIVIVIIILIIAILGLFLVSANDSSDKLNRTILNVSSEGPIELSKITDDI